MQTFETLPELDQVAILARVLALLSAQGCKTIDDLASQNELTVDEVWADICVEAGSPECTIPARLRA